MKKNQKQLQKKKSISPAASEAKLPDRAMSFPWLWTLFVAGITFVCFLPSLQNGFTNWDDDYYVLLNQWLRGPDWRSILTRTLSYNYHPLTLISLALNYQVSGLDPFSYHAVNLLLHLCNTVLVIFLVWKISGKKAWVAIFTGLVFGIHPLHVESVAWVAERKDVLYTLFYLLSLISYWNYLERGKPASYWSSFVWFVLSLLSKPAAIVLPLALFLLDYWKSRQTSRRLWLEKVPFLLCSLAMAVITVRIQQGAIIGLGVYPMWTKLFFACYALMTYIVRFFIPVQLSAFHPYPPVDQLGWAVLLSPLFVAALCILLWFRRKDKSFVFGLLFYVVNLLLVLQVISIGSTIISERYTYVPYLGLAFLVGMWLEQLSAKYRLQNAYAWILAGLVVVGFGPVTFRRTQVWKDPGTLWADVIRQYPNAPVPRGNRARYLYEQAISPKGAAHADSLYRQVIEDCTIALEGYPGQYFFHETRALAYLRLDSNAAALSDADSLIRLATPGSGDQALGYSMMGRAQMQLNEPEKALESFTACLKITPNDDNALLNRGAIYYTRFQKYPEALADYTRAIEIRPMGEYYANRSSCYYSMGQMDKAKADAETAVRKGVKLPQGYLQSLGL